MTGSSEDRRGAAQRVREAIRRVLAEHASPAELGLSVALGVFLACTPFYGLQTILALGLAWLLRLNRVAAVLAAQASTPPLSPVLIFASVQLGEHLLSGHFFAMSLGTLRSQSIPQLARTFFTAWLLGGCVLGGVLGAVAGGGTCGGARARGLRGQRGCAGGCCARGVLGRVRRPPGRGGARNTRLWRGATRLLDAGCAARLATE